MFECFIVALAFVLVSFPLPPLAAVLVLLVTAILILPGCLAMRTGAPYVATPKPYRRTMTELAAIQPGERVVDLGSGDGSLLKEAARRGATAIGYELSLPLYEIGRAHV